MAKSVDGNMDIQIVLDYFAVITYLTDYYAKDDTGTMEIIKAALEDTASKDEDCVKCIPYPYSDGRSRSSV